MGLKTGAIAIAVLAACATTTPAPAAGDRTPNPAPAAPTTMAPIQPSAPPRGIALVNPGFESTAGRTAPEGWFTHQHAGDKSYEFTLDTTDPRSGLRSLRIDNVGKEPYGAITQSLPAKQYGGKVARLSGWLRSRDANDAGGVLTIVALQSGAILTHNFMAETPVKGTTGWKRYAITMPVPKGAERIEIGAMMQGKGSLWLDDVELDFVEP